MTLKGRVVRLARAVVTGSALALGGLPASPAAAQAQAHDLLFNVNDTGSDPLPSGGTVAYNFEIGNAGAVASPVASATFSVPANARITGITGLSSCTPALPLTGPGTLTCPVPALAADDEIVGTLSVLTQVQGSLTTDFLVSTAGDADPANNDASETTTVLAGADLAVAISGPASAAAGSTVSYALTASNAGPNAASGVRVEFPRPTGLGSVSAPGGCALAGSTYTCAVSGSLAPGDARTLTFTGQVTAASGSTLTVLTNVVPGTPGDPVAANNTATLNTTVTAGSDLSIAKARAPAGTLLVGQQASFTLTGRYTGDDPGAITVTDVLPSNYTPGPATGSGWTCSTSGQTVQCTRPAGLGAGSDVALPAVTIPATVAQAGTAISNTAAISAASPADPNAANNTASDGGATIESPRVDLRANKTGPSPGLVVTGNSYPFALSTTNLGNTGFFGTVRIADALPAGFTITGVSSNGWACAPAAPVAGPATLTCERAYASGAPLAPNQTTPAITVTAQATATGTRSNLATVSIVTGNLPDADGTNNTASVTTTADTGPNATNVGVSKATLGAGSADSGAIQSFLLTVSNSGPRPATNVTLTDDLAGLVNNAVGATGSGLVSVSTSQGLASAVTCSTSATSATSRRLSCAIPSLPVCTPGTDCPTITVDVRPGGNAGSRTNSAAAFSQSLPDTDTSNNAGSSSYAVVARTDVAIAKVASPDTPTAGQELTYVLTARALANGLSDAAGVVVTDALPANVTFLSATSSAGSCGTAPAAGSTTTAGSQVSCALGTIANGAQQTVTIVVRPNTRTRGTTLSNTATVSTTTPETDAANNSASVATPVQNPTFDLLINTTESVDPVAIGDTTVYTLTARNNGPSAAETVVVTDRLPTSRLSFQSFTVAGGGSCDAVPATGSLGGTLSCTWPSIPAGESRVATVTMLGTAKGVALNSASVTSDEAAFEASPGNNMATQSTTVRTRTDMQVVSVAPSQATINLREPYTWAILVRNNAGANRSEADDVVVSDALPAGMELTGTPTLSGAPAGAGCTGAAGSTAFACSLGTVPLGSSLTVTVPVRAASVSSYPQVFTNAATVATSSLDVVPANDSASGTMTVNSSSLAGRLFRDFADDAAFTANDTGISGVTVTLAGTAYDNSPVSRTATTAADGSYSFPFLPQGTYSISHAAPAEAHLGNGTNTAGSAGGTNATASSITGIALPSNTAATGYLFAKVPQARIGVAKQVVSTTFPGDGSFVATFSLVVGNLSLEPVNVTLTDALAGATPSAFGAYTAANPPTAPGTYTISAAPSTGCGAVNAGFTGSGANAAILSAASRPAASSCTLTFSIRVRPPAPLPYAAANRFQNQAQATGTGAYSGQTQATNPTLSDLSDDGAVVDASGNGRANDAGEDDVTPVAPAFAPSIALVKTGSATLSNPVRVGDVITYTFAVTNTGNTTLTNVGVTDPKAGLTISGSPIASLAPGATSSAITGTYAITQADINARLVTNQATATGTHALDAGGNPLTVTDLSGTTTANNTATTVTLGSVALVKTASTAGLGSPPRPGQAITYGFAITNTGAATLSNLVVTDPLTGMTIAGSPVASLAPAASTSAVTGSRPITQADIDRGYVDNQATVSARYGTDGGGNPLMVSDLSGSTTINNTVTRAPVTQTPGLDLVKTVSGSTLTTPAVVGQTISYAYSVRNSGNTTLATVTVTDPKTGLTLSGSPIASLAPGATSATAYTGTYAITQADIDAGRVLNQATATGRYVDAAGTTRTTSDLSGPTAGTNANTVTPVAQGAAITLVKTSSAAALANPVAVGNAVSYGFTVRNAGNVTLTNVVVSDPLTGLALTGSPIASLAPGASSSAVSGTYAVRQADINRGYIDNQATATGGYTDAGGTARTASDLSGATAATDAATRTPVPQAPAIALIKTASTAALGAPPQPGRAISYAFQVRNTGNVDLAGVTVTDPLTGLTLTGGPIPLAAGATNTVAFTGSYPVSQADIDRGFVDNRATVTGGYTDAGGTARTVQDLSGSTYANDTTLRTTVAQAGAITLVKTATLSGLSTPPAVGDPIAYAFAVRNAGNATLTGVSVAELLGGAAVSGGPITLAPGASDTTTFTATYALTQADIDRGYVDNQARASGSHTNASGAAVPVSDLSGTAAANDAPTRAPVAQAPSIALVKTLTGGAGSPAQPGQTLSFAFRVTNTGNTTLATVSLTELLAGASVSGGPIASLAPGAADATTFTATYPITQGDIDAGQVSNSARVAGGYVDAGGTPRTASDLSGSTNADDAPLAVPLARAPALRVVKTADVSGLTVPARVGQAIAYAVEVRNTGNTTLGSVSAGDPLLGGALTPATVASLAPGASASFTGSRAITQADINRGYVDNQATGRAVDAVAGPFTAPSRPTAVAPPGLTRAPIGQDAALTLVKTVAAAALSTPPRPGDRISYAFTVRNAGNTTLTDIGLTDLLPGAVASGGPIASLAPGDSDAATFTATYAITQADIDAGRVLNQARATGSYADAGGTPRTTSDLSGTLATNDLPTLQAVAQAPAIDLVKTADTSALSTPPQPGDPISYAFEVRNLGNVTLADIQLTDAGAVLSGGPITLAPGGSDVATFTATRALTQGDIDAGVLQNQATATGRYADPVAGPLTASDLSGTAQGRDDPTRTPIAQVVSVRLVKAADASGLSVPAVVGQRVSYSFAITNTGNTTLTDLRVSDTLAGVALAGGPIAGLAPGDTDTATFTATYAITQGDTDAGQVVNDARVEGTQTREAGVRTTASGTDAETTPVAQDPRLTVVKTADASGLSSPARPGDAIGYSLQVLNLGNTTLSSVRVEDPLLGGTLPGVLTLAPGEDSGAAFQGTYAVTQGDIDAGVVRNQASATASYDDPAAPGAQAVSDLSGPDMASDAPLETRLDRASALMVNKTADTSALSTPAQVGEPIAFTVVVTNTGNASLEDVRVSDPLLQGLSLVGATDDLAPGDSVSFTGSHAVRQGDIDRGYVDNQATATARDVSEAGSATVARLSSPSPTGAPTGPTRVPVPQGPALAVVKAVDASGLSAPPRPGDVLAYAFTVLNTGNTTLADVTVADPLLGAQLTGLSVPMLAPGDGDATTFTGTYAITQADIDAGVVTNQAIATGGYVDAGGTALTVSDASGATSTDDAPTEAPLAQVPAIAVVKVADASGLSSPPRPGDVLSYAFQVRNAGNQTLTGVALSDAGAVASGGPITLAPGATDATAFTATHTLTQGDIDAGSVVNQATATGTYTPRNGAPATVSDRSGTSFGNDAPTVSGGLQAPALSVTKAADASGLSTPAQVGERIAYAFEVENQGNVTLADVSVADPLTGIALTGAPVRLAPGQIDAATFSGTYAITQDDIDAGAVNNQATATASYTDADGAARTTTDASGRTTSDDIPTSANVPGTVSVALVKTADASGVSTPAQVGEEIAYAFRITNTGTTTLEGISVADPLTGVVLAGAPPLTLAPGASDASVSGTYAVTQADIDRGFVLNQARVDATHRYGGPSVPASDLSGATVGDDDPTRVPLAQGPEIALVKDVDLSGLSTPPQPGDVLAYALTVSNTGNVTLSDVRVEEMLLGATVQGGPITLAPGESDGTTFTATYAITQDDIDAGEVLNQARASGSFSDPLVAGARSASDLSGATATEDAPTRAALDQVSALAVSKTADVSGLSSPAEAGDGIGYAFTVRNTGNVTLSDVTLSELLPGATLSGGPIAALAPGQTDTATFAATYALVQDDVDAGLVDNQVLARGDAPTGPVADLSGPTLAQDAPTRVILARAPALAVVKTADASALSTPAQVGDVVSYAFEVINTGSTTLTGIALTDPLPGVTLTGGPITLAPGATDAATFAATYAIIQADIDRGFVLNQATARGTDTGGAGVATEVEDLSGPDAGTDAPTRTDLGRAPSIALVKTVDASALSSPARVGDTLTYRFAITNTGNATLTDVEVSDPLPGLALSGGPLASLAPGDTDATTFTATYTLTQGDLDAGEVVNEAAVSGSWTDASGAARTAEARGAARAEVVGGDVAGSVALVKTADASGLSSPPQPGDLITYAFEVINTGSATLTDVLIADPLLGTGLAGGPITLAPGGSDTATFSGSYVLTQADVDEGAVSNQATVSGSWTDAGGVVREATDLSGTRADLDDPTVTPVERVPGIELIKRAVLPEGGLEAVGDPITYTFEVINTGNTALEDVTIVDALEGLEMTGGPLARLEVGARDTTTFRGTYALRQEDFARGSVENQATVRGTYDAPGGEAVLVDAQSQAAPGNASPTTVMLGHADVRLGIAVGGTTDRDGNGFLGAGDGVTYAFTVTNAGTLRLDGVTIDPASLSLPDMGDLSCAPVTLPPGETAVLLCGNATHTITPEEAQAGRTVLSGEAVGLSPAGQEVRDPSEAPATPLSGGSISIVKEADREEVLVGETVSYAITLRHGADGMAVSLAIRDRLPEGLAFEEGSARLDGAAVEVRVEGNRVLFPARALAPGGELRATLSARVLSGAQGTLTNRAVGLGAQGGPITAEAEETVRVTLDPAFSCGTVIGRVFDDRNGDGRLNGSGADEGERGLPGVRLVGPSGVAVTTDAEGRFSLPCDALPTGVGENVQMRLDERTLPAGATLTTENPRVVRVTPGMVAHMDFGAAVARPVRIDLDLRAFSGASPSGALRSGLATLAAEVAGAPAAVRLVYHLQPNEAEGDGQARLDATEAALRARWRGTHALRVDAELVRWRASP